MKREFILAVKIGDIDSVKKMLKAGANANITDEKGIPAILFAGANGNKEMIELLLSANADIKSKNQLGRRILLYYLHFSYPHSLISTELIQKLIQAGADVNAMDSRGITVLNLAATYNDKATINLLKRAGARKLNKTNAR